MHHRKNSSLAHILNAELGHSDDMLHPPKAANRDSLSYFSLQDTSPRSSSSSECLSAACSEHDWRQWQPGPSSPGTPSKLYPRRLPRPPPSDSPAAASPLAALFSSLHSFFAQATTTTTTTNSSSSAGSNPGLLPLKAPPSLTVPRLNRRRTVAVSFVALLVLSLWTLLTSSLTTPTFVVRTPSSNAHTLGVGNLDRWKAFRTPAAPHPHPQPPSTPLLALSPQEELAALVAFISTLSTNSLPPALDPSIPIDPSAILSFDLARLPPAHARAELAHLALETWAMHPLVVFGKSRHPPTRALRILLDGYATEPLPTFFHVDQRPDRELLMPVLRRIVGPDAALAPAVLPNADAGSHPEADADSDPEAEADVEMVVEEEDEEEEARTLEAGIRLPMLFVAGQFIPQRDIPKLVDSGDLLQMIKASGARTGVARRKGKGH